MPIAAASGAPAAWDALGRQEAVIEAFVDLEREISVIGARGVDGAWSHFGPIENTHRHHILDVSVAPAGVTPELAALAVDVTRRVMVALDFVGILCVEFFVTRDGRLLINELAPRPHNSGHLTFDACRTSQFEQQLRAICGLPLGIAGDAAAGGDGESARRSLGRRRAELVGRAQVPGREAALVRKDDAPSRAEDGTSHGAGGYTPADAKALVLAARDALRR